MESSSHYSDTAGHPEVPETHRLVLRTRGDHPASPCIQWQNVTWTATQHVILHVTHFVSGTLSLFDSPLEFRRTRGWMKQSVYLCVRWGRADPALSDSRWCICYSLQLRRWSRLLLHFLDPPWRPGLWWCHHACWTQGLGLRHRNDSAHEMPIITDHCYLTVYTYMRWHQQTRLWSCIIAEYTNLWHCMSLH